MEYAIKTLENKRLLIGVDIEHLDHRIEHHKKDDFLSEHFTELRNLKLSDLFDVEQGIKILKEHCDR